MVKKLKQMADKQTTSGARVFDSAIAGQVKDSAQQIWLAGMGAFSRAHRQNLQPPLQHDADQAHAHRTAELAQEVDAAGAVRDQPDRQAAHGPQV